MCCCQKDCSSCDTCQRLTEAFHSHAMASLGFSGVLITGQPKTGKTFYLRRLVDETVLARFIAPIHLDQMIAATRLCRLFPQPSLPYLEAVVKAARDAGRIPVLEGSLEPSCSMNLAGRLSLAHFPWKDRESESTITIVIQTLAELRVETLSSVTKCQTYL